MIKDQRSPIQVVTGLGVEQLSWSRLLC